MNVRILSLTASFLMLFLGVQAQKADHQEKALDFVHQFYSKWGLQKEDVGDISIRDDYTTKHNQVQHIYLQQRHQGIPIHNAISGIHLSEDGKILHHAVHFQPSIINRIDMAGPLISAKKALFTTLQLLQAPPSKSGMLIRQTDQHSFLFDKGSISQMDIPVQLNYFPVKDRLLLSWEIGIYPVGQSDYWSFQIDARTGEVLEQENLTLYCTFEQKNTELYDTPSYETPDCFPQQWTPSPSYREQNSASYLVFPFPIESPIHGERRLLVDPADPLASPYGWHDTNAVNGPEFFTTKGNNVYAYFDTLDNNQPDGDEIFKQDLNFNFPFDPEKEPNFNREAALTQLFYAGNLVHDFAYYYGFDEQAGNFQNNNYGRGGQDEDEIITEAMDGSGFNNANFLPLPDGSKSRMQMYLWDRRSSHFLNVESPPSIRGSYLAGEAEFGPAIDNLEIRGQVVQARDASEAPSTACETIINKEELAGKVALIYRGKCPFTTKVLNAQKAGAKAVIIVNHQNSVFPVRGTPVEPIHIPTLIVSSSTAERIINAGEEKIEVNFQRPKENPESLDGSFDNGVIAHEYAHGISTRLTGGPSTIGCLRNDEQMGEGWSDFFGLVMTTPSAAPEHRTRGIGNYANGSQAFSGGIRRRPYSPSKQINEFTYKDIIHTSGPHELGEIWAGMLWDLYWAFSDQYGWDPDLFNGQGGNNMAIQLVMDALKLQACRPGFIDGRDAILKADSINFKGANQCLIWSVFAQRGLGWSAEQGDSDDRKDGTEAFDVFPSCIQELKISKTAVNTSIDPGEPIRYKIEIRNDKPSLVSELIIQDQLPEGANLIPFAINGADLISQNGRQLTFKIGQIDPGKEVSIQYFVQTSPELGSGRIYFDDFSDGVMNWEVIARSGGRGWRLVTDTLPVLRDSWFVPNSQRTNSHFLELQKDIPISGQLPVLRFHHSYVTEPVSDAGLVEVSQDGGQSWEAVSSNQFLRNGYDGEIDFSTFLLHDQGGFWGHQPEEQESIIDLSNYIGKEIRVRFQFQSDSEPSSDPYEDGIGWSIYDIEFMDLYYYDTEVCINSDQGDVACARAKELGTTVSSLGPLTTSEDISFREKIKIKLYPNPVDDFLNIQIDSKASIKNLILQVLSSDGRIIRSSKQDILPGQQLTGMNVSTLPAGIYFLRLQNEHKVFVKK